MTTTEIRLDEITFHPASVGDANGRLFRWDGKLYRAIAPKQAELYRGLLENGLVHRLAERGLLIETSLADLRVEGAPLVLEHREVPFVSYPYEWSGRMLQDAAVLTLDLAIELAPRGLIIQDAHPWNVLFEGTTPRHVDFGSICPLRAANGWVGLDTFLRFALYPLVLTAAGHGRIARWLLHDGEGVLHSDYLALGGGAVRGARARQRLRELAQDVRGLLPAPAAAAVRRLHHAVRVDASVPSAADLVPLFRKLKDEVQSLSFPTTTSNWSRYYDDVSSPLASRVEWDQKQLEVERVLSELRPRTLLDVGSNQGWFSFLGSMLGSNVVAFDVDEGTITQLYLDARKHKAVVLPLIMDFVRPSPGAGIANREYAPASERLSCECVLALALVHHLVFKQGLRFEQICRGLTAFAIDSLVVEFVPPEDRYVREWWNEDYGWYTLEGFVEQLRSQWKDVTVRPSHPEPRVLVICRTRRPDAVTAPGA